MNKEQLKNEISEVLEKYDWPSSKEGLSTIVDTWSHNKAKLIELFSKHSFYKKDKFMIAFNTTVDREIDVSVIHKFFDMIYKRKPGDLKWTNTLDCLYSYSYKEVDHQLAAKASNDYPKLKIVAGMKTTKAVQKILLSLEADKFLGTCTNRGVEKKVWDREYAAYCNALNPLQIVRHTVVSLHPVDYLLSSNGNSWSSCHTIDKHNPNGYSGCNCSGTLSYMLDPSTIVFYQVDESYKGNELEKQPKIIRQLFHYDNGVLIQGRMYPQCNDGKNSLYSPTRAIMQSIISTCLDIPNLWRKKGGTSICTSFIRTTEGSTHYLDYCHQSECNVSRLLELLPDGEDERKVVIGHKAICPTCGMEHTRKDYLHCSRCGEFGRGDYECGCCGRPVSENEVVWVDGEPYCNDCTRYCDICDEYYLEDECHYIDELCRNVCDGCLENYYTYCTCEHYEDNDDCITDVHGNVYCSECADELLTCIDGSWYPIDEVKICPVCGREHLGEEEYCDDCLEEAENEG